MKHSALFLSLLMVFSLFGTAQAAQFYKWKNEKGAIQYTNTPPPTGTEYELVRTYGAPNSAKEAIENLERDRQARAAARSDNQKRQEEFEEQKKLADMQAKAKSENCERARNNLKVLTENHIIRRVGDDGQAIQLTPEQKQAEIDKANEMIKLNCSGS